MILLLSFPIPGFYKIIGQKNLGVESVYVRGGVGRRGAGS